MEKEKLIIKNFGPIKEVDLDLGRFTILIGEQATGKSTVAKVLAMCRYFSYIAPLDLDPNSFYVDGLRDWGLQDSLKLDSYISYDCYHYFLEVKTRIVKVGTHENGSPTSESIDTPLCYPEVTAKSPEFINLLNEFNKIKPGNDINDFSIFFWRIPTSFFQNDVKSVMDNPFYLPTERGLQSVFSLGQTGITNLDNFLFNYFSKIDGALQFFTKETTVEPLGITYLNINGRGYIKKESDDKFFPLRNAASGYQSTIPVVLVMKYQNDARRRRKTFIIEEPELNLFPAVQDKLMRYLVDQTVNYGNSMVLTTHSPYTLTSINNMMYAYQVGQTSPEKVSKELDKKYWLDPEDVSAYMMKPDGSFENILDEDGLIKAEKIDEVSKTINKKFNAIMDIELGVDETTE